MPSRSSSWEARPSSPSTTGSASAAAFTSRSANPSTTRWWSAPASPAWSGRPPTRATRRLAPDRIAIFSWGAAEIYWTAYIEGNPAAPYPSPADVGYLVFYPLAYAGLALLVRARAHEINWRLWMDGAIAALGTAALGTAFVFDFIAEKTTGTTLKR